MAFSDAGASGADRVAGSAFESVVVGIFTWIAIWSTCGVADLEVVLTPWDGVAGGAGVETGGEAKSATVCAEETSSLCGIWVVDVWTGGETGVVEEEIVDRTVGVGAVLLCSFASNTSWVTGLALEQNRS